PQFLHGLFMSSGVFVECLAQIAVLPDPGVVQIVLAENQPACAADTGQQSRPHNPPQFAAHLPDSMPAFEARRGRGCARMILGSKARPWRPGANPEFQVT